jgi:hypothetical protein
MHRSRKLWERGIEGKEERQYKNIKLKIIQGRSHGTIQGWY